MTDVARTDSEIQFIANTGEKDRNGKEIYATYKTGPWPDEQLTERLLAHKEINFQKTIVEPVNPLLSFFLTWILPILIFVFLGNMMAKLIDEEVIKIVREQHQKALQILKENEGKLHEIAEYLLDKETITGEEFMDIFHKTSENSVEI